MDFIRKKVSSFKKVETFLSLLSFFSFRIKQSQEIIKDSPFFLFILQTNLIRFKLITLNSYLPS